MSLVDLWFGLVVLCWVLFFVLEGFDFGVGILAPLLGRDEQQRAAAVRTVGPVWDGNEVWLVAAIGVTFAAFPAWYAALLSGLYLPMAAVLLLLAGRGVALEFRGKGDGVRWRRRCDVVLATCSAGIAALWGAVLTVFVHGLALDADGQVSGVGLARSLQSVLTVRAAAGALVALWAALLLGAAFLALRTTGALRRRARRLTVLLAAGGALVGVVVAAVTGGGGGPALPVAVLAGAVAMLARSGREAAAFGTAALGVAGAVIATLTVNAPVVLPSTLDPAWSLTMADTAATGSALRLISMVAVVVLPGVLVYQAYSYWVFRHRVGAERIPS